MDAAPTGRHRWVVFATEPELHDARVRQVEANAIVVRHRLADGDWFPWCLACRRKDCEHAVAVVEHCRLEQADGSSNPDRKGDDAQTPEDT